MIFYCGTHKVNHAWAIPKAFISVNVLRKRFSNFKANDWILDSGAFSELSKYGAYRYPVSEYAQQINRWAWCWNMELAVTQDYMCEPSILQKTLLTVKDHQWLTVQRYEQLISMTSVQVMPVLQGYEPIEYLACLALYGNRIKSGMRVGVGSICKRNSNPRIIIQILSAIKAVRPDLRLHGFGLKITALENAYIASLLYSADSMAWSYTARRKDGNANGLKEALEFYQRITRFQATKPAQLSLI